jgi:hypothetical protein
MIVMHFQRGRTSDDSGSKSTRGCERNSLLPLHFPLRASGGFVCGEGFEHRKQWIESVALPSKLGRGRKSANEAGGPRRESPHSRATATRWRNGLWLRCGSHARPRLSPIPVFRLMLLLDQGFTSLATACRLYGTETIMSNQGP